MRRGHSRSRRARIAVVRAQHPRCVFYGQSRLRSAHHAPIATQRGRAPFARSLLPRAVVSSIARGAAWRLVLRGKRWIGSRARARALAALGLLTPSCAPRNGRVIDRRDLQHICVIVPFSVHATMSVRYSRRNGELYGCRVARGGVAARCVIGSAAPPALVPTAVAPRGGRMRACGLRAASVGLAGRDVRAARFIMPERCESSANLRVVARAPLFLLTDRAIGTTRRRRGWRHAPRARRGAPAIIRFRTSACDLTPRRRAVAAPWLRPAINFWRVKFPCRVYIAPDAALSYPSVYQCISAERGAMWPPAHHRRPSTRARVASYPSYIPDRISSRPVVVRRCVWRDASWSSLRAPADRGADAVRARVAPRSARGCLVGCASCVAPI